MIEAIIFDMDGVLADTEPIHCHAWVIILREFGVNLSARWFDRFIGIPDIEAATEVIDRFDLDLTPRDLIDRRQSIYERLVEQELQPFPGLRERLDALPDIPLAVATSSSRLDAENILARTHLASLFGVIVTCQDVTRTKPDPEIYTLAAGRLGLGPGVCAAIEDSPAGTRSARAAGCLVLGVTTTHAADQLPAAHNLFDTTVQAVDWLADRLGSKPA